MAHTTEGRFQDDGLWKKLLTRAQQGTTTQGFFVIDVVEGCLHTSMFCKLGLPTAFMRNHFRSLNERIILEDPDGYQWTTMLGLQWDSQPCLMHGWKEFATAYDLEIRDQVVFLLFDNSHFLVQVYDVNNKVKGRRIFASPVQVSMKARNVSQEETRAPNSDLPSTKAKHFSQAETRAPHSDVPSTYGVKTGRKKNVIFLESSDEEKEKEDGQVRVKETPIDAFTIGGTFSKMTLRSAKRMEEDGTQDHSMKEILEKSDHLMKDVSPRSVKKLEKSDPLMKNVSPRSVQKQVRLGGGEEIMDRELGKSKRGEPAQNSASTSPEHILLIKRSKKLSRKLGDYKWDELERAASVLRSGKNFKQTEGVEKRPRRLHEETTEPAVDVTKIAFQRVPGSEILTSCCSTQQSTMKKRQRRLLQESTSQITQPPVTVPELNATNTESVPELTGPETPGDAPAVKPRPKVKVSIDEDKMRTEKLCLSENEASKRPTSKMGAPGTPFKLLYISRRRPVTTQERQDTLAAARTFANKSADEHCIMQLTSSQVYCGFHLAGEVLIGRGNDESPVYQGPYGRLDQKVPQPEFVEAVQLPLARLKVSLSDKSGKLWEVEWLGDHPKWPGLHSAGWTKFVLEHYLEEGDVCVFQKSKEADNMISVEIFPIVPLVATPENGWRSHYMVPEVARTVVNSELPDQS